MMKMKMMSDERVECSKIRMLANAPYSTVYIADLFPELKPKVITFVWTQFQKFSARSIKVANTDNAYSKLFHCKITTPSYMKKIAKPSQTLMLI